MNSPRIAIVMSGHPRMVPYGYYAIQNDIARKGIDVKIYSCMWNDSSDNKLFTIHNNLTGTDDIFKRVSNFTIAQEPILRPIYDRLKDDVYLPDYDWFARQTGQIVGFLIALGNWKSELEKSDIIIRSRWDVCIDPSMVDEMINETIEERFITKFIDIHQGVTSIYGDVILGRTKHWYYSCYPFDKSIDKYIRCVREYWNEICQRWTEKNPTEKVGQWYNYHTLWPFMFRNSDIWMTQMGYSYRITEKSLDITPETFNSKRAI